MITTHNLETLKANSEDISEYLAAPSKGHDRFNQRLAEYRLDHYVAEKLKAYAGKPQVFVFSAEWCPDCYRNVPVLKLINDATGIETRVFGHLMRDAKNPNERWRIPPSPEEVREFDVTKIPFIVVLDGEGAEIGEIVENPPTGKTLELALLNILEKR